MSWVYHWKWRMHLTALKSSINWSQWWVKKKTRNTFQFKTLGKWYSSTLLFIHFHFRNGLSPTTQQRLANKPEKTAKILRHHHWNPRETTSENRNERRNSILMTRHYPGLERASNWFKQIFSQSENYFPDLGSVASSVWNFCSRFDSQTSFRGHSSGSVAKCRLFCQAIGKSNAFFLMHPL